MVSTLRFALILGGLTWCAGGQVGAAESALEDTGTAPRFRVEASVKPLAWSSCGRFALEASVRHQPAAPSTDGRYALKSVHTPTVGCDPQGGDLFTNGFESP